MQLNSLDFMFFLSFICLFYFMVPDKIKNIVLLTASYVFYARGGIHVVILFLVTVITYLMAYFIDKSASYKKRILIVSVILEIGILAASKYFLFFSGCFKGWKIFVGVDWNKIVVPLGVSFYILQAIGYLIDVYREKVSFERNFIIHALFLSFFPYAVSGPVERAGHMFEQFRNIHRFDYERVCHGMQLFLWGGAVKVILADRLAVLANELLSNPVKYTGFELVVGAILYTLQIYCDFSAYSDMAVGTARILGFDILQNFMRPYFAETISDFWSRWHRSFSFWLRDYLYFTLGGSRKGLVWKHMNLGVVFLVSGIWHGTGWNFIVWGLLHTVYYIYADLKKNVGKYFLKIKKIRTGGWESRFLRRLKMFLMVAFAWVFFYASDLKAALKILQSMFSTYNIGILFSANAFNVGGMVGKDWIVLAAGLLILMFVDILREKKIQICKVMDAQSIFVRWSVYMGLITAVILFGVYGPGYEAQEFIYQAF